MTRMSLDDARWASLVLAVQQIPLAWKRGEAAQRRFVEAALWTCRTGAPWRGLPEALGLWSSVYHRWRRRCLRGWWESAFEAPRPNLPTNGPLLLDGHHLRGTPRRQRCRGGLCSKLYASTDGAGRVLRLIASPRKPLGIPVPIAALGDLQT